MGTLRKILLKYKVLHIIMWLLVGSSTFFTYYDNKYPILPQILNAGAVMLISTIPFYITAYLMVPQLLYKRKFVKFIFFEIVLIIVCGILMMIGVRAVDHIFQPGRPIIPTDSATLRYAANIFIWTCLIASFGAGGLKIMSDSFKLRKKLYETENERIKTELNFLRSQINPHFLFNAMNTIYFQIDKRNTVARESVEKLSEMLRYQLYECTSDKIDITQELEYIKSYVTIQSLRMEKGSDIKLKICDGITGFQIAPLLILPIVENAFKHISHYKDASLNKINISLCHENKNFVVEASNTYDQINGVKHLINSGGLGVQNLRRRLELLYPNRYELDVKQDEKMFHTTLNVRYYD